MVNIREDAHSRRTKTKTMSPFVQLHVCSTFTLRKHEIHPNSEETFTFSRQPERTRVSHSYADLLSDENHMKLRTSFSHVTA